MKDKAEIEAELDAAAEADSSPMVTSDSGSSGESTAINSESSEPDSTSPPALRAFVLRPPPRRVMQKQSYESVSIRDNDIRDVRGHLGPDDHIQGVAGVGGKEREIVNLPDIPDEPDMRPMSIASDNTVTSV